MIDMYSASYRDNPYPYFQKMRAESPVFPLQKQGCWAVSRYEDVKNILKNHELFSSTDIVKEPTVLEPDFLFYTRGIVGADKPEHTRLRQLLYTIFPQNKINHLEPFIRLSCRQLLDLIKERPAIDFVKDFTAPLPMITIAMLLGLDEDKIEEFRHWVLMLLTWRLRSQPEREVCNSNIFNYLTVLINRRKASPGTDLISKLILASVDKTITQEEVFAFIRFLIVGGTDTSTNLLGNVFRVLLEKPEYISYLQDDPQKIPAFVDETLRYDGPVLSLYRRATQDISLDGMTFKANDLIFPLIASANHDETIFLNPENFDMDRNEKSHLSFGSGIHHCFSSQLAKLQVTIACEEILQAWNFFAKADDKPYSFIESFFFRGIKDLPITIEWK